VLRGVVGFKTADQNSPALSTQGGAFAVTTEQKELTVALCFKGKCISTFSLTLKTLAYSVSVGVGKG
jgi:hypothetical protein